MSKAEESLNREHTGYEYYVEDASSSAPMMYFIYPTRTEAEEYARPHQTIYVREVGQWKEVP